MSTTNPILSLHKLENLLNKIPVISKDNFIPSKMADQRPKQMSNTEVSAAFTSYYLQRATKEFAEDLDTIRNADDFRNDAVPILINALSQGTTMFSPVDQRRIAATEEGTKKSG
ncbi:ribosome-assembly protein 3-domain-containing protein [Coniella lustricola]|uniref:Ribosome assembly protein 3 n=1 Tax=Coniella lustricola TaxID=2025994 RepID=A0A2T3A7V1_9PEZI|nr:ribosome-assembly protein 3-domain-containing protein [Coniella lustricola]